jgi:hypothetical protein
VVEEEGMTRVVHIGLMKSGTSFIQDQLFANKAQLLSQGVVVPGEGWNDQVRGVTEVLGRKPAGLGDNKGAWDRLVSSMSGPSIISMEFLGPAPAAAIRRIARDLPDARIVITARDLNRSIAALWQETVQNGRDWSFDDYRDGVRRARPGHSVGPATPAGTTFWRQQDLVRIAGAWREVFSDVVVITVPPPGAARDLLMQRFATACGFSAASLVEAPRGNESLGAASILALRRMNQLLNAQDMVFPAGSNLRKHQIAKRILAARKSSEPSIGLTVEEWVPEHAAAMRASLEAMNLTLIGDWAELEPVEVPGVDPASVSSELVAEAAIAGLTGLVADRIQASRK